MSEKNFPTLGRKSKPYEQYFYQAGLKNDPKKLAELALKENGNCSALFGPETADTSYYAPPKFNTIQEYQQSFGDILSFRASFLKLHANVSEPLRFDVVLFHDNNDGIFSVFAYWKYFTETYGVDQLPTLQFFTAKPDDRKRKLKQDGGAQQPPTIKLRHVWQELIGKRVLVCDLNYASDIQDWFHENCSEVLFIDDHFKKGIPQRIETWLFVGEHHASSAYTWKFFFPEEEIPLVYAYIDNNDKRLFMPFICYGNPLITFLSTRFTENPKFLKRDALSAEGEMWDVINNLYFTGHQAENIAFGIMIGIAMNEMREMMKEAAVKYAIPGVLELDGVPHYKIGMLSFDHETLSKVVGREIIVQFRRQNIPIDLSVVWGYHVNKKQYHVTVTKSEERKDINMEQLKTAFRNIPGVSIGGHDYEISMFMPKDVGTRAIIDEQVFRATSFKKI